MIDGKISVMDIRPAEEGEVARMSCPVLWMYERGQTVVLWKGSGVISLAPESLPKDQVVLLQKYLVERPGGSVG
jgi:hypothetical protein